MRAAYSQYAPLTRTGDAELRGQLELPSSMATKMSFSTRLRVARLRMRWASACAVWGFSR
jgi:hypothetical protein